MQISGVHVLELTFIVENTQSTLLEMSLICSNVDTQTLRTFLPCLFKSILTVFILYWLQFDWGSVSIIWEVRSVPDTIIIA